MRLRFPVRPACALCALAAVLLAAGCASAPRITSAAAFPRQRMLVRDEERLVSDGRHWVTARIVSATISRRLDALPTLAVEVTNRGAELLVLSAADVTAASGSAPVRVYTQDELAQRLFGETRLRLQGVAFTQSQEAGDDKYRRTPFGAFEAPGPAMHAQADRLKIGLGYAARREELVRLLTVRALAAGQTGGGLVKLHPEDIVPGRPLTLTVRVDREDHVFHFDVGPDRGAATGR